MSAGTTLEGIETARSIMVGRRLAGITVSGDGQKHVLTLDNGEAVTVSGYGDCCAWTYLHDITGLDKAVGPIVGVEPDVERRGGYGDDGDWEVIDALGWKMVTDHPEFGPVTTVFAGRCEHNGYYSGWFEFWLGSSGKATIAVPLDSEVWSLDDTIGGAL